MQNFLSFCVDLLENLRNIEWLNTLLHLLFSPGWWQLLLCFLACSLLMVNRLNAIEKNGFQGTLIGTLIMPYASGFPNLCFAYLVLRTGADNTLIFENSLVNNITNLTLILAIPCLLSGLNLKSSTHMGDTDLKINHLSLLLSILAMVFFCLATLLVAHNGEINRFDGLLLVGLFLFWQTYQVFDVLKNNTRNASRVKKRVIIDLVIIGFCAWGIFSSMDLLLAWAGSSEGPEFIQKRLGFFSGLVTVIPNAFLCIYYALIKRNEIAYSSQIGDCHICIPLCIGLFAIFSPITLDKGFETLLWIIIATTGIHFIFAALLGRLPRFAGVGLLGLYFFFIYQEMI